MLFLVMALRLTWIVNLHKVEIIPFKKSKMASYKEHSGTKLDRFQPMDLETLSFLCLCYF